jgi:membrane protease YdiL (CAAX protease family)
MNSDLVFENRHVTGTDALVKPMRLSESMLMFGIPAVLLTASLYGLWPLLASWGLTGSMAYALAISSLNIALGLAALVGYRLEGRPRNWSDFSKRMRLTALRGRIWWWVAGGVLVFGLLSLVFVILLPMIYKALKFVPPEMTGIRMNLFTTVVVLFFNIVGEELWWRGYILPCQELSFGKTTWWVHGILWACFHIYKWWGVPAMMITCCVIPFVAQRTRNTWPGVISHFIVNGAGSILSGL